MNQSPSFLCRVVPSNERRGVFLCATTKSTVTQMNSIFYFPLYYPDCSKDQTFYTSRAANPSVPLVLPPHNLLVVSPAVPPCCFGQVLAVCERRGFGLGGLGGLRLQSNGAADLGLSEQQVRLQSRNSGISLFTRDTC